MRAGTAARKRLRAAAGGALADLVLGEPARAHPVAAFGRLMVTAERFMHRDSRAAGVAYTALGMGLGVAAGRLCPSATAVTYAATAGRRLREAAGEVAAALEAGDVAGARRLLPGLVGRDPTDLGPPEITRAVVESVAENTVDAVVGPLWWAAVLGGPGAAGYRAANTLDAMVGHRSPRYARFGWAAARLDDGAGYLPARLTALLVAAARPRRAAHVWRAVRHDAPAHPSPNAGVAEAAFAAALGIRLGGTNVYGGRVETRPRLGQGRPPRTADIGAAARLSRDVTVALATILAVASLLL
ncbi:MAG TPA: adenosylcobinamide-phosphate synthase CbiB [Acidimicrobiales bacterium]|nr:adenosylcobinamide-phosphate synthase CbiB [Acidimicrobiales bacterium]